MTFFQCGVCWRQRADCDGHWRLQSVAEASCHSLTLIMLILPIFHCSVQLITACSCSLPLSHLALPVREPAAGHSPPLQRPPAWVACEWPAVRRCPQTSPSPRCARACCPAPGEQQGRTTCRKSLRNTAICLRITIMIKQVRPYSQRAPKSIAKGPGRAG